MRNTCRASYGAIFQGHRFQQSKKGSGRPQKAKRRTEPAKPRYAPRRACDLRRSGQKMKTATWNDIELCLNHGTLADQDRETLEAFLLVPIPSSSNPRFHERFKNAKDIIRDRLKQIEANNQTNQPPKARWHDHPSGKITIGAASAVIGGLVVWVLTQLLKHRFPFLQ